MKGRSLSLSRTRLGAPRTRWAVTAVVSVTYAVAFVLLRTVMGEGVTALSVLPVCVAAWLFGLRGGLLAAGLAVVSNFVLLEATGGMNWALMREGGATGIVVLVLVGAVVGRMSDLAERLQRELVEHRRTEKRLRERTAQLEALQDISMRITSQVDLDELLQDIVKQGCRLLDAQAGSLHLFDRAAQRLRLLVSHGYKHDHAGSELLPGEGIAGRAFEGGELLTVADYAHWEGRSQSWEDESITSSISVPLKREQAIIGTLTFDTLAEPPSKRRSSFGERHRWVVSLFANVAAIAIAKADLVAALRRQTDQLEDRVAERTAEVEAQMARMETVLNSVADGIVVTDSQDNVVLTNPVARDWLQQADTHETNLRATIQALSARAAQSPRESVALPSLDLELSAASISGSDSGKAKAVVTIHDVTHLRALDRMRTRFITSISHELKTPVATIKVLVQLMGQQPEQWREHWEPLREEIEHLGELIEGVVTVANLDARRQAIDLNPVDLNLIVEQTVAGYEEGCAEEGLRLIWRPAPSTPIVTAAPRNLTEVLRNLLDNATQYTPPGGQIVVAVDTATQPPQDAPGGPAQPVADDQAEDRAWAMIEVSDTGWGIPEEERGKVFDRFFRGEKALSMQISGTGLGLAVAQEIMALHGGRITVESRVGEGSTFTVWLPLEEEGQTA